MSEKVTFQELIESIAEETDNSKQFTHDFLKDFVAVINSGLENDGNVNIAGLGKFELRHVDEREGYNPQTEERMTIPAHNRIVFKPYKDLRELVNAPYAHLEPELIKEEFQSARKEETEDTDASDQEDFIPTAPPTSHKENLNSEDTEEQEEAPFDLDEPESELSSSFSFEEEELDDEDEEDIVEFSGETADDDKIDDDLSAFFGNDSNDTTSSKTEPEEEEIEEPVNETIDGEKEAEHPSQYTPEHQASEDDVEETEESAAPVTTPPFDSQRRSRENNSVVPIIAAAMVILILVAGGAWYLGLFSSNSEQLSTNQAVSTAQATSAADTQTDSQVNDHEQTDATTNNQQSQHQAQQTTQSQADQTQQSAQSQGNQTQQTAQTGQNQQAVQASQNDRESLELTISEGETLWSIAYANYRDSQLWPWIYDNNEALNNPNIIHAGNTLTIPLPSKSRYELSRSDSVAVAKGYLATYRWFKDNGSSVAKNYLWVAKTYHGDLSDITEVQIDKDDLAFANTAR